MKGIRDFRDVWRAMKYPFTVSMQVTGEHYDAIVEAAVKELIDYGAIWEHMRVWGQKKNRTA